MLRRCPVFFLLLLFFAVAISCSGELPPLEGEITDLAEEFIACLVDGEYDRGVEFFSAEMKRAMSARGLAQTWEQLLEQMGPYVGEVGKRIESSGEHDAVIVTTAFEHVFLDIRVVFDKDRRVAGLWFNPAQMTDDSAYTAPAYVDPELFSESEVTVGSGEWALPGTLAMPAGLLLAGIERLRSRPNGQNAGHAPDHPPGGAGLPGDHGGLRCLERCSCLPG